MLQSYSPIYQIALELQEQRSNADLFKKTMRKVWPYDSQRYHALLETIYQRCSDHSLTYTSDMAKRISDSSISQHTTIYFLT